ncbi:MAG: M3 family metallopeptidase [Acidobacteriota bacterium]|nr:M3 family metallopeptidase [Acidobacteriota bacterium]
MPLAACRLAVALTVLIVAVPAAAQAPPASNPFFEEWKTPFGMPPFERIKAEHYAPAFEAGIAERKKEVGAIASNPAAPTFANTVEALENGGLALAKVSDVFFTLTGAETNDALQAINKEFAPKLSALRDDVLLNEKLFARVKTVWEAREKLTLSVEQKKLLEETFKDFVRGGANLAPEQKKRFREINQELSVLGLKFADNLLKETNGFRLVIDRKEDLAGLPPALVSAAADAAKAAKLEGKWVFTSQAPSILPFLTFAENRDLRKKILDGYTSRGDHGDAFDNKASLSRIAALRSERARLLGYKTHADFVLEENMAKTPAGVYGLLDRVWAPSLAMAKRERADLDAAMKAERKDASLEAWDWRYYSEKVRKARFDLDDKALRPYFPIDRVREGIFYAANRLYGLTFTERTDVPKYHPEVRVFEVKDADGSFLALYTVDYYPRPGKRSGAWCGRIRPTWLKDGKDVRPIVTNVTNVSRPAGDAPALLSLEEVRTLFHEFGHAVNGFVSRVSYRSMGRTSRDFVELPSQIMESWALEPEVLKVYAKHWKTGETIPLALVSKIEKAGTYGEGFRTTEYLAASYLDMDWHALPEPKEMEASAFEKASLGRIGLIPEIVVRYRSPYFQHIFGPGGGYSAGYYSYIWSDVLVADAYDLFREKGIFDKATATSFRKNILEKGGTEDAMTLYKRFRGREPSVEPLLVKRGLAEPKP